MADGLLVLCDPPPDHQSHQDLHLASALDLVVPQGEALEPALDQIIDFVNADELPQDQPHHRHAVVSAVLEIFEALAELRQLVGGFGCGEDLLDEFHRQEVFGGFGGTDAVRPDGGVPHLAVAVGAVFLEVAVDGGPLVREVEIGEGFDEVAEAVEGILEVLFLAGLQSLGGLVHLKFDDFSSIFGHFEVLQDGLEKFGDSLFH